MFLAKPLVIADWEICFSVFSKPFLGFFRGILWISPTVTSPHFTLFKSTNLGFLLELRELHLTVSHYSSHDYDYCKRFLKIVKFHSLYYELI